MTMNRTTFVLVIALAIVGSVGGYLALTHSNESAPEDVAGEMNRDITDTRNPMPPMPTSRNEPRNEMMTVGPSTVDCVGLVPKKCLVVNGEYFYDDIIGFTHEPGYTYELEVRVEPRPEPLPADASDAVYYLVHEISRTPAEGL